MFKIEWNCNYIITKQSNGQQSGKPRVGFRWLIFYFLQVFLNAVYLVFATSCIIIGTVNIENELFDAPVIYIE